MQLLSDDTENAADLRKNSAEDAALAFTKSVLDTKEDTLKAKV